MNILFVVPDLFGSPGGIARNCRLVAKALIETTAVDRLDILALRDVVSTPVDTRYLHGDRFTYTPFNTSRIAMARAALVAMGQRNYDAVISAHVNLLPVLFTRRSRGRRVAFMHGKEVWRRLPWHRRWFLQRVDDVISVSQFTARRAIAANDLNPDRVQVLHNCLDPTFDRPRATRPAGRNVLTVARLSREEYNKGHDVIMRALPTVLLRVPDVTYHIVGEGDLRPELERLAVRLGVQDRVLFHGAVSDQELALRYEACSVFAMPSTEEGFGFVFLEAMLYGRSIVASTRDAGAEVVGDNEAGILVDPGQPEQVATALSELLIDEQLRHRLGQAGRDRVFRLFDYESFKRKLWQYMSTS